MHGIPRPEHPRPDIVRSEWLNLNGEWEFAETDHAADKQFLDAAPYPDRVIVPFCRESNLSGLHRRGFVKNVWYRRALELPSGWDSRRVLLHIGACDWRTRVWLNGTCLGTHTGGSTPFSLEITKHLQPDSNTVVIHAYDDTRSGLQPLGKQSAKEESHSCVYTRTTGIWQTVWLEGVGESFVKDVCVIPEPSHSRVVVNFAVDGSCEDLEAGVTVLSEGRQVGSAVTSAGDKTSLTIDLSDKHLWSPEDPFLYDLKIELIRGDQVVDSVDSYFGLREVSVQGPCILIDGKPVFQRLVLDQGYYPDGVWTAPTDEALRRDIELSKALGFNGARLHQKVFEPRFLYWADRLGYLVWGEYPNWGLDYANPEVNAPVVDEWTDVLVRDRNHPCIVGWCPFNETPPEAAELQNQIFSLTCRLDPSRPVIDSSGWTHTSPDPIVLDAHDYNQDPSAFAQRWADWKPPYADIPGRHESVNGSFSVPFMVSEYGGIGWNTGQGWGYGNNPEALDEFYARYENLTNVLLGNRFMFGFCYTQLTDIEQERNGLYTFDRQPKFDIARIRAVNSKPAAYESNPPLTESER